MANDENVNCKSWGGGIAGDVICLDQIAAICHGGANKGIIVIRKANNLVKFEVYKVEFKYVVSFSVCT